MDSLHFSIAMLPLAMYLLLLGIINLSSRPFITSGVRDVFALGIALSGFVIAGPMELFLPESAAARFGPMVWLLLICFYGLCLTLIVLLTRPRLVIYNISNEQFRPLLANVVAELDKDARWAGESLVMPNLGVQLYVEPFRMMQNLQLIASGPRQNYSGWRKLELAVNKELRDFRVGGNPHGVMLISLSVVITVISIALVATDRSGVADSLAEMLRQN